MEPANLTPKAKKVGKYTYRLDKKPLGGGSYGTVYQGYEHDNPKNLVAIKLIDREDYQENKKLILREVKVMEDIKGKYILQFIGAVESASGNLYIITEYCDGGNLSNLIEKEGGKLSIEKALKIVYEVALAFQEIKSLGLKDSEGNKRTIMHRDIKPANILIQDGRAVLGDYGFAKFIMEANEESQAKHTRLGTPNYSAIQVLKGDKYSSKCDIWSLGVVLYETIFGKLPWTVSTYGKNGALYELVKQIETQPIVFDETTPEDVKNLINGMLEKKEAERLDWDGVLTHSAFKNIAKEYAAKDD